MIEVRSPMHLRAQVSARGILNRATLMYGPVMLAAEGRHSTLQENPEDLKEMEESKGRPHLPFADKGRNASLFPSLLDLWGTGMVQRIFRLYQGVKSAQ